MIVKFKHSVKELVFALIDTKLKKMVIDSAMAEIDSENKITVRYWCICDGEKFWVNEDKIFSSKESFLNQLEDEE